MRIVIAQTAEVYTQRACAAQVLCLQAADAVQGMPHSPPPSESLSHISRPSSLSSRMLHSGFRQALSSLPATNSIPEDASIALPPLRPDGLVSAGIVPLGANWALPENAPARAAAGANGVANSGVTGRNAPVDMGGKPLGLALDANACAMIFTVSCFALVVLLLACARVCTHKCATFCAPMLLQCAFTCVCSAR